MAVARHPAIQHAYRHGKLIVANGITNAYVLEELTGEQVEKGSFTAGVITDGVPCITDSAVRQPAAVFVEGRRSARSWQDVAAELGPDDVFVKGANAIDIHGNAGVLLAGKQGGTIGIAMGFLAASGAKLIMPIGLEKLIPNVRDAARVMGQRQVTDSFGLACGIYVVSTAEIVTEVEALEMLFDVDAIAVAAGGVAGTEGAITLAVCGTAAKCNEVISLVKRLKQEPPIKVPKRVCGECASPCLYTYAD